jgi:hypothetical protein
MSRQRPSRAFVRSGRAVRPGADHLSAQHTRARALVAAPVAVVVVVVIDDGTRAMACHRAGIPTG